MGLSLRNVGKKISDVAQGVERQLNMRDNGATYNKKTPQRIPGKMNPDLNGGAYGNAPNVAAVRAPDRVTFNPNTVADVSQFNVNNPNAHPGVGGGASPLDALHPITRAIPELATLLTHKDFVPRGQVQQAVFGKEPVQTFTERQKGIEKSLQQKGGLAQNLATPLSVAGVVGSGALDVASVVPIVKAAQVGVKEGVPLAKEAVASRALLDQAGGVNNAVKAMKATTKATKAAVVAKEAPVAKPIVTGITGDASGIKRLLQPVSNVLNTYHSGFGDLISTRRELAETGAAQAKAALKVTNTLNKDEGTNLARVLKGVEKPMNDKVSEAVKETRKVLDQTYYRAKNSGVKVANYRSDYFPQIHNPEVFKQGTGAQTKAINYLVKTGQAPDEVAATKLIRSYKNGRTLSPYSNLSKSRTIDLPNYAENVPALHHYLDQSYASIAHAKTFGKNETKLNKILNTIRTQQGDEAFSKADKYYRVASGIDRGSINGRRAANIATGIQGGFRLGLSAPLNATQNINTAVKYGIGRTVKSAVGTFAKGERDFLAKTGVADEQVAHEAVFGERGIAGNSKVQAVLAPGFQKVEKFNRRTAALAGRDSAMKLADRVLRGDAGALRKLQKDFGISSVGKGGLTEADQIKAARAAAAETQFRTEAQDLPAWATSNLGRVITQFKRYPYKQSEFLWKNVIQPATQGNLAPLARMVALGGTVSIGTQAGLDKIRGNNFQQSGLEKGLDVFNTATGGELTSSLIRSVLPTSKDANGYITKLAKAVGGPTASDAVNAVSSGFDASKGKTDTAARFGLTHLPVVGTPVANRVVPYKKKDTNGVAPPSKEDVASGKANVDTKGGTLSATDRIKASFTTDADKKFLALSESDKKAAAENDPDTRKIYQEWLAIKSAFKSPKLHADGLDDTSRKMLDKYNRLTTTGRDAVAARDPNFEYDYALAKYNDDKLSGKLTNAEDIKARQSIAKKKVGTGFDKNIRDIYSLTKNEIEDYLVEHPQDAQSLIAYDNALVAAGLLKTPKFKNGFGSGSGSSSSKVAYNDPYAYTISTKSSSRMKKPTVSVKAPAQTKVASSKTKNSRPAVSLKASKV